ncbi:hypothetical protein BCV72DRAFT_322994 [Rhizopus microsporus var. microsporus]|uniref:Uncharacterized protein n=1 Tax=Rhizopus microsporus var. microsporus TaxID=86635 RepID=A0A1X0R9B9_RHIZD|nr:hypothetical protein BCV72DRAFT_322994 [Rhizopus microsporus var. microsporus]
MRKNNKTTFAYIDVPFKSSGYIDSEKLIQHNTHKTLATMNMLSSVGVNLSAINNFTASQLRVLEEAQNNCIKKIYGARGKASTKAMLHTSNILQVRFLFRSLYLSEDALLACLLPYIHKIRQRCRNSKLLSSCRRSISLDPMLWLLLYWLLVENLDHVLGVQRDSSLRTTAINCLDMHRCLFILNVKN